MKVLDITGHKYGRLTAIEKKESVNGRAVWLFTCDCGSQKIARMSEVRTGKTSSCGCLSRESKANKDNKFKTHNMYKTREYKSWQGMKERIYNKNSKSYDSYGGRGLKMSKAWTNSFDAFYKDMGPRPTPSHSIDRVNNNIGYFKENCRWATARQQVQNRSVSLSKGLIDIIELVARENKISYSTAYKRIKRFTECLHKANN